LKWRRQQIEFKKEPGGSYTRELARTRPGYESHFILSTPPPLQENSQKTPKKFWSKKPADAYQKNRPLERFRRRRLDQTQNPSLLQPLQPLYSGSAQSTCAILSTTTTTPLHNLYATWAKPISTPITTQQVNPCLQSLFLPNDKNQQFSKHFVEPTKPLRQAKYHPESLHWESDTKRHLSHQPVFRSTQQPKTLKSNKNLTSRRLAQRRNKRALKTKNLSTIRQTQPLLRSVENRCLSNFGFIADPNTTLQKNFDVAIQRAPSHLFLQPKNLTFHNLCKVNKLPPGSKELLGLNLKLCLASKAVPDDINKP